MRNNFKQTRLSKKMTQAQLAKVIGASDRMIQHIEAGTRLGDVYFWLKASKVLEKPIEYLVENNASESI